MRTDHSVTRKKKCAAALRQLHIFFLKSQTWHAWRVTTITPLRSPQPTTMTTINSSHHQHLDDKLGLETHLRLELQPEVLFCFRMSFFSFFSLLIQHFLTITMRQHATTINSESVMTNDKWGLETQTCLGPQVCIFDKWGEFFFSFFSSLFTDKSYYLQSTTTIAPLHQHQLKWGARDWGVEGDDRDGREGNRARDALRLEPQVRFFLLLLTFTNYYDLQMCYGPPQSLQDQIMDIDDVIQTRYVLWLRH
jgi:hypothetical protein